MLKPKAIGDQSRVLVFIPSSPVRKKYLKRGIRVLNQLGFIAETVPDVLARLDYTAKAPREVIEDIRRGFEDPRCEILWAGRGGYGANFLLSDLSRLLPLKPKIVIGASDVSPLLWFLMDQAQMVVFYGPMVCTSLARKRFNRRLLVDILRGRHDEIRYPGKVLKQGSGKGRITGGCLSNLASLVGSPYFPRLDGRILFIEDTRERPYRVDRMLWQLVNAGKLEKIKGLVMGRWDGMFSDEREERNFYRKITGFFTKHDIPVVTDVPVGHIQNPDLLPLGVEARIDTREYSGLILTENAVNP